MNIENVEEKWARGKDGSNWEGRGKINENLSWRKKKKKILVGEIISSIFKQIMWFITIKIVCSSIFITTSERKWYVFKSKFPLHSLVYLDATHKTQCIQITQHDSLITPHRTKSMFSHQFHNFFSNFSMLLLTNYFLYAYSIINH